MTVAARQGYEAGRLGVALSANPYLPTSLVAASDWRLGWLAAEKDADDANVEVQFREPKR